jgi:hypothetical protein
MANDFSVAMMHFSNTQAPSHCDHQPRTEKNLLRFQMLATNLNVYHSLRDAHGKESNNFNIATFGQYSSQALSVGSRPRSRAHFR